ncbi:hypothetical protein PPN31114_02629 [Pandoraea pneumonica]|uniref:Uncharacterized protein n=1 Tax=Pandoraea pneumonica TaxID=2508299 RepID=A0A5E4VEH4_9BURK|nr:hypothetical protein PPN31114_02629 [Pandoraea pneumonica]
MSSQEAKLFGIWGSQHDGSEHMRRARSLERSRRSMTRRAGGHHVVDQHDASAANPIAGNEGITQIALPDISCEPALRRRRTLAA